MWIGRLARSALLLLAAVGIGQPTQAEKWPQRPVRIVVPFAAGGSSDVAARVVAQHLSDAFGQQVVVEDRPGASGALAAEVVARAPADGYTILLATTGLLSVMPLVAKTAYDPVKDLAPVSVIGTNPFVLVVHASVPAATLAEFLAFARAQPSPLSYAASGVGSLGHLSMELLLNRTGLAMTPVMYKGGSAQLNDVIAGHVKVTFLNLPAVRPFAASGTLRLLAVTGEKRSPQIPDVPTLVESGFPTLKVVNWSGLMVPAGTPKEIIDRIAGETSRAVRDPRIADLLVANGIEPLASGPEEFAAIIAAGRPLWAEAVRLTGLEAK
jgi:tripartite-type tricarboxylate transporter receptor subunit TctC